MLLAVRSSWSGWVAQHRARRALLCPVCCPPPSQRGGWCDGWVFWGDAGVFPQVWSRLGRAAVCTWQLMAPLQPPASTPTISAQCWELGAPTQTLSSQLFVPKARTGCVPGISLPESYTQAPSWSASACPAPGRLHPGAAAWVSPSRAPSPRGGRDGNPFTALPWQPPAAPSVTAQY